MTKRDKINKFVKQLFCNHAWTITTGTGIFQKGNREIMSMPVVHNVCVKCELVKDLLLKKGG